MSERKHALAQQLFGKTSVEECELKEVKALAQRYPYFAPAQFLFLEKLKQENSEDYAGQLQKAILYYHNPLEFEYFISSDKFYTEINFEEEPEESYETEVANSDTEIIEDGEQEVKDEKVSTEAIHENILTEETLEEIPAINQEPVDYIDETEIVNRQPAIEEQQEKIDTSEFQSLTPEQQTKKESYQPELHTPNSELQTSNSEPQTSNSEPQTSNSEPQTSNSEPQPLNPEPEIISESPTDLIFEPFHTVDYFASQGIKLSQDEAPKDKFGKSLKSFTEWLKTMKRLPSSQMANAQDASIERKVQHLADDSIHEAGVYTEAMAEVWIKQGNLQKAIEIYNKLSLLNPSKKAFFAAKIENIKLS